MGGVELEHAAERSGEGPIGGGNGRTAVGQRHRRGGRFLADVGDVVGRRLLEVGDLRLQRRQLLLKRLDARIGRFVGGRQSRPGEGDGRRAGDEFGFPRHVVLAPRSCWSSFKLDRM
ncbi:hypothetical protein SDC9_204941 [bioreactor metagenome]|uniref:Uncharacterized protein n=1 Tax=bioreactor metagenome TaxID=1076179 RepID=A0A645J1G8_9ZZZZ